MYKLSFLQFRLGVLFLAQALHNKLLRYRCSFYNYETETSQFSIDIATTNTYVIYDSSYYSCKSRR